MFRTHVGEMRERAIIQEISKPNCVCGSATIADQGRNGVGFGRKLKVWRAYAMQVDAREISDAEALTARVRRLGLPIWENERGR